MMILLPLSFLAVSWPGFELNTGQAPAADRLLTPGGLRIQQDGFDVASPSGEIARFRFQGSRPGDWKGIGSAQGHAHYQTDRFSGRSPIYSRAERRGLYHGIDWIFRRGDGGFEYDFAVAPGADPRQIRLHADGPVALHPSGAFHWRGGRLLQRAPVAYQEMAGGRQMVASNWVTDGSGTYRLEVGAYRRDRPLIIDPLIESAATFGGTGVERVVGVGPGWVAGVTRSFDWERERGLAGGSDVFVRIGGDVFLFGGEGDDEATAVIGIGNSDLRIAGWTNSRRLPALGSAAQPVFGGGTADGFVATFQASGFLTAPAFVNATYVGGDGDDKFWGATGNLLLGETDSTRWPGREPVKIGPGGGRDALFAAVRPSAFDLVRLGGTGDDRAVAATFANGSLILAGETTSSDFPGAIPGSTGIWVASADWPVSTHRPTWRTATITGRTRMETVTGIASLPGEGIYVAGDTRGAAGEPRDGLLLRFDETASRLLGVTTFGGSGDDRVLAITRRGPDLLLSGMTNSPDFPWRGEPLPGQVRGGMDGFLAHVDDRGRLVWSSPVGGPEDDEVSALDAAGVVWCGGATAGDAFAYSVSYSYVTAAPLVLGKDLHSELKLEIVNDTETDSPIQLRSSDPARLLVSASRFQAGEASIVLGSATIAARSVFSQIAYVQALSSEGEVELILSGPQYPERRVRVQLAPSQLFARRSTYYGDVSLPIGGFFEGELFLAAVPGGGREPVMQDARPGVDPAIEWRSSDPAGLTNGSPGGGSSPDFVRRMQSRAWRNGEYIMTPFSPAFPAAENQQLRYTVTSFLRGRTRFFGALAHNTQVNVSYDLNGKPQRGVYRFTIDDPSRVQFATPGGGASPGYTYSGSLPSNLTLPFVVRGRDGQVTVLVEGPEDFTERLILPVVPSRAEIGVNARRLVVGGSFVFTTRVTPVARPGTFWLRGQILDLPPVVVAEGDAGVLGPRSVTLNFDDAFQTLRCNRPGIVTVRHEWPDSEPWETTVECVAAGPLSERPLISLAPGLEFVFPYPAEIPGDVWRNAGATFTIRDPAIALVNGEASFRIPLGSVSLPRIRATGRLGQRTTLTVRLTGFADSEYEVVIVPAIMRRSSPATFNEGNAGLWILAMANAAVPAGQSPWEPVQGQTPRFETATAGCTLSTADRHSGGLYYLQARCSGHPGRIRVRDASGWLTNEIDVPLPDPPTAPALALAPITIGNGFQIGVSVSDLVSRLGPGEPGFTATSDESKLRLSSDPQREGAGEVRFEVGQSLGGQLWLQAYAGDGSTRVVLTNGRRRLDLLVYLRPGTFAFRVPDSSDIPITQQVAFVSLVPAWTDPGVGAAVLDDRFRLRPGLPLTRMPISSSDPAILAVESATPLIIENLGAIQLSLRPNTTGTATLGVTLPEGFADSPQRTVTLRVVRNTFSLLPMYIGAGVQTRLRLRSTLPSSVPITITSLDPDKVLLADFANRRGGPSIEATYWEGVWVQGLSSEGVARLRIEARGSVSEISLPLYPTALGLAAPFNSAPLTQGEATRLEVVFGPVVDGRVIADHSSSLNPDLFLNVQVSSEDESIARPERPTLSFQAISSNSGTSVGIIYGRPGTTNLLFRTPPNIANRIEKLPVTFPVTQ